jgi:hypothetical protein
MPPDEELDRCWAAQLERADAPIFGRVTPEAVVKVLPARIAVVMGW